MSFSTGFKDRTHLCQHYVQLKQKDGEPQFVRWDKDAKEEVFVDLSKGFVVLEYDMMTIVGYNQKYNCGIWSNEIRTGRGNLKVQSKLQSGFHVWHDGDYKSFKDQMQGIGAKYCQSVYIGLNPSQLGLDDGPMVLANLKAFGAALEGWFAFSETIKSSSLSENVVCHDGFVSKQRGSVNYQAPVFKLGASITAEQAEQAHQLDLDLQVFLEEYLSSVPAATVASAIDSGPSEEDYSQERPDHGDALSYQLKDGSTLRDHDLPALQKMMDYLNKHQVDPRSEKYLAIQEAIMLKSHDLDDDEIPF